MYQKIHSFKMYSCMVFNILIELGHSLHYLVLEHFHLLKKRNPVSTSSHCLRPLLQPWQAVLADLTILNISYQ